MLPSLHVPEDWRPHLQRHMCCQKWNRTSTFVFLIPLQSVIDICRWNSSKWSGRYCCQPARMELGIVCCKSKTKRNILSSGGRKPSLSARVTIVKPPSGTRISLVAVIAIVVRTPSSELPAPGTWITTYIKFHVTASIPGQRYLKVICGYSTTQHKEGRCQSCKFEINSRTQAMPNASRNSTTCSLRGKRDEKITSNQIASKSKHDAWNHCAPADCHGS